MVVDIACTCLIGFVWIIELYVAFTGGTECRRHPCSRGESSFRMSVSQSEVLRIARCGEISDNLSVAAPMKGTVAISYSSGSVAPTV